jgi:hypothetical protein
VFHDRWFSVWCFVDHCLSISVFSADNCNVCSLLFTSLITPLVSSNFHCSILMFITTPPPHRNTFASCLIRHTKGTRKGVRSHQGTRELCWIVQDVRILRFYSSSHKDHKFLSYDIGCWKTQVSDCTGCTVYIS